MCKLSHLLFHHSQSCLSSEQHLRSLNKGRNHKLLIFPFCNVKHIKKKHIKKKIELAFYFLYIYSQILVLKSIFGGIFHLANGVLCLCVRVCRSSITNWLILTKNAKFWFGTRNEKHITVSNPTPMTYSMENIMKGSCFDHFQFCSILVVTDKQRGVKKGWNIQHVANVGQRKNLSPRWDLNPWPSVHRSDALTTELLGDSWRA